VATHLVHTIAIGQSARTRQQSCQ